MIALVTTGLFSVQFSGGTPSVHIYISSFVGRMHIVPYQVNWIQPDGAKSPLHQGVLPVAPRRTATVSFSDVQGRTLEVNLDIPDPGLKPTVALIGTFLADGAEEILLFVSPDEFMRRDDSVAPEVGPPRRDSVRAIFSSRKVAGPQGPRRTRAHQR